MRIRYTVTTITQSCPHCHKIIKERTFGDWTPVLSIFAIFILPVVIPAILIHLFAFQNPRLPKVGEKLISCPHCALPIRTGKRSVEELNTEELFIHNFKPWFCMSYVMGAICGISCCCLLIRNITLFPLCVFLLSVSLIWIIITAFVYRKTKKRILKNAKNSSAFFYCSRCGTKLPLDSLFCNVCGLKVE